MGFDLDTLTEAVRRHGRVARVVVAETRGSAPREVGAAMLVWEGGQSGTIGGGALEFAAARSALTSPGLVRHALGPGLGQCCGGSVTLLTEIFDAAALARLGQGDVLARGEGAVPLAVARILDRARAEGLRPAPQLVQGWMIEPRLRAERALWIWGAGHVGRAVVSVMAPLPDWGLTWVDTAPERFPDGAPDAVRRVPASEPERLLPHAPKDACHLILTYSHETDFRLCHAALSHGFGWAGLIGSDTKWARFRKRLAGLGHAAEAIDRITCPIGDRRLGKHPHSIAIGVAAELALQTTGMGQACQTLSSASRA